mgnify:CR=1 FL=1
MKETWHNIIMVIRRELRIWMRRPTYILGSVFTMVFCSVFYLSFLKDGVPSDVPIGVVDYDNSSMTRTFADQLDATQLGKVVHYDDFTSAREDMQSGKITSIVVLPEGMYADVQSQRQPKISFYVNGLYFLGGSLAYKDILTMVNLTSGALQRQVLRMKGVNEDAIMGRLRPIDLDIHQIGNPTMNYGAYLANMMLPGMLEMVIIIMIIYALGTELKYGTSKHLLQTAGGDFRVALFAKIAVYTLLFTAVGFVLETVLYRYMHFPMAGNVLNMLVAMFAFVLACEAIGIFIIGLFPVTRFALSIGGLYSVLALSLTGFSLPVEAMPGAIQGFSACFPLRHFYLFYVQEGIFASGFAGWYQELIHLLLFVIIPVFVMRRLESAYINQNYPKD